MRQARLIGLFLAAPFLAAPLVAQLLAASALAGYMLAALCLLVALSWTGAVVIAQSGKTKFAGMAGAVALCLLLAALLAASGIVHSPLVLLLAVPPFEAWFVHRDPGQVTKGWMISAAALLLACLFSLLPQGEAQGFAGHFWITPIAYALTVWLRIGRREIPAQAPQQLNCEELSRITGSLVAEVNAQGSVEAASGDAIELLGVSPVMLLGSGLFDRMRVTDRVLWLTSIDRCRRDAASEVQEVLLRRAGSSEHRRCRISLAPASSETVFVLISQIGENERRDHLEREAVIRLERPDAAQEEQKRESGWTDEGQEETRRFA